MPETLIKVNRFSGLNNRDAAGRIQDSELMECQNFDLGRAGELIRRTGINQLISGVGASGNVYLLGLFQTSTVSQILFRVGVQLYYYDGNNFTLIGTYNNMEQGVQYADKFYIVRRDDVILQWDGAALTTIPTSPSGTTCRIYKDRMFVSNSFGPFPSRVYYSKVADFSTAGWNALGSFVDVQPGDGDVVVAFALLQDNFIIFKAFSTWILYVAPDVTAWQLRNASPEIGCTSKYTPREIEGFLYFVGPRGVYKTDGSTFDEISTAVHPIFRQQVVAPTTLNQTCAAWWEDKYIVLFQSFAVPPTWGSWATLTWDQLANQPWDSANATYTWLVYHLRSGAWTHWKLGDASMVPYTFTEVRGPSGLKGLYLGSRNGDGKLFRYGDAIYADNGFDYLGIIETKDFDFGEPTFAKRARWMTVESDGPVFLQAAHIADENEQATTPYLLMPSGRSTRKFAGPGFCRTWRVRVTSSGPSAQTLYGIELSVIPKKVTVGAV